MLLQRMVDVNIPTTLLLDFWIAALDTSLKMKDDKVNMLLDIGFVGAAVYTTIGQHSVNIEWRTTELCNGMHLIFTMKTKKI